jgi:hypothetical protein
VTECATMIHRHYLGATCNQPSVSSAGAALSLREYEGHTVCVQQPDWIYDRQRAIYHDV